MMMVPESTVPGLALPSSCDDPPIAVEDGWMVSPGCPNHSVGMRHHVLTWSEAPVRRRKTGASPTWSSG